jgi:hypothetical protein
MANRACGRAAALLGAVLCLTLSVPATAQLGANGGQFGANARRTAPKNYASVLKTIAADMATHYNVRIVVDPAIFIIVQPKKPDATLTVDKAMDALAATAKDLAWRRVYLSQAQGDVVPAADKLAAAVRALDQVEQTGFVLENPLTAKATTFVKNWAVTPNFADDLTASQFNTRPLYVLYTTKAFSDGRTPQERLADLQRQSMEMMLSMDPDQIADSVQQGFNMLMSLDPDTRARIMGMQMQAGMKMFQSMTPEQRQEMMQMGMQMFQGLQGGQGAPRRP